MNTQSQENSLKGQCTPMTLLPYQQQWCGDNAQVKVVEKSRRIGISWAEAADTALLSASTEGMDAWYIGYNKDMAMEFIRDCANWSKQYNLVAGEIEETEEVFIEGDEKQSILSFVIRFASGWRITALSSRPSNLRGKQGRVIIDEAAFHEQLGELLKAAMALLMWGGQVHIISTHNGVDNPFNELINDIRAGKKPYSLHCITFNEAVEQGLYKRICLRLNRKWSQKGEKAWVKDIREFYGDDASEELDCIPKNSGGRWLNRVLIENRMSSETPIICLDKKDEFALLPEIQRAAEIADWITDVLQPLLDKLDRNRISFLGEDFARTRDRSSFVPLLQQSNLKLTTPFIIELGNIPFSQQEQILKHVLHGLPNLRGAALDARGNGQALAEAMQDEFGRDIIQAVMLSEGWYRTHTAPFKAALEDGTIDKLPKDEGVLTDLRSFEIINGVPRIPSTRINGQNGHKRHGDTAIALLLAHYASRELNNLPLKVTSRKIKRNSKISLGYFDF